MGLIKSIKKAVKSVVKGFKKAFGKILKPFSKILQSKAFRAIMAVSAVFTMGATLAGGASSLLGNSTLGNIAKSAGDFLTKYNPLKMIGNAVGKAWQGVKEFAGIGEGATGAISEVAKAAQTGAEKIAENTANGVSTDAMANGASDSMNMVTGTAEKTAEQSMGVLKSDGNAFGVISDPAMQEGVSGVGGTGSDYLNQVVEAGTSQTIPQVAEQGSKGLLSQGWDMAKKAGTWVEEHPKTSQMLFQGLAAATAPDDWREDYYKERAEEDARRYRERENFYAGYQPQISYGVQ